MSIRSPMGPKAAALVIGTTNLAFAAHYAAWKRGLVSHGGVGIDPFAGDVVFWFLSLGALAIVELVIVVRGYLRGERAIASVAAGLWLAQVFTLRFLFVLLEGV